MEEEIPTSIRQKYCEHWKSRKYQERCFDIINGFELVAERCCNCHKILELRITSISDPNTITQTR